MGNGQEQVQNMDHYSENLGVKHLRISPQLSVDKEGG